MKNAVMNPIMKKHSGFTVIEFLLSAVLFVGISAVGYQFLSKQNRIQHTARMDSIHKQEMRTTLSRFESDVRMIDPNWKRLGISVVYPHPGLHHQENTHDMVDYTTEAVSDGITFLRKDRSNESVYRFGQPIQSSANVDADNPAIPMFNDWIELDRVDTSLAVGNWLLVYKPGSYVLTVITETDHSGSVSEIKVELPGQELRQILSMDNELFPFVSQAGVVPASYDYTGSLTADIDGDDEIFFPTDVTMAQVVQPVTYELDWKTSDGMLKIPNVSNNQYVLDTLGQKQSMVARTEYDGAQKQRTYMARSEKMNFAYDLIRDGHWDAMIDEGYFSSEEIVRDFVGFNIYHLGHFFSMHFNHATEESYNPLTSSIVGIKMKLFYEGNKTAGFSGINADTKIALDTIYKDDQYKKATVMKSHDVGNVHAMFSLEDTEHVGSPIYFRNTPDDADFIALPVMNLDYSENSGKLAIMDKDGCDVVNGCSPDMELLDHQRSLISFGGDGTHHFFPTHVESIHVGGREILFVNGMGMVGDLSSGATRKPMIATIDLSTNSIATALASNNNQGNNCSLAGCSLHVLETQTTGMDVKDTSASMFYHDNHLWFTSLTKASPGQTDIKLYKSSVTVDGSGVAIGNATEITLDTTGLLENRVISAVGDRPIEVNGTEYLPMCMTRSIQCIDTSEEIDPENTRACNNTPDRDGKIYLYDITGNASPIHLADQNYRCSSLQAVNNGLLVGSKLVTQVLQDEEISDIAQGNEAVPLIYTDEVSSFQGTRPIYADAYYTYNSQYSGELKNSNPNELDYSAVITWNSGTSIREFNDGSIGLALGNRYIPETGDSYDDQTVLTVDVYPGGMKDPVSNAISTNLTNLNASSISNFYQDNSLSLPQKVVLPGSLYANPSNPRYDLMPLPYLNTAMTEMDWLDFFADYHHPSNLYSGEDYNLQLPANIEDVECAVDSIPSTCS